MDVARDDSWDDSVVTVMDAPPESLSIEWLAPPFAGHLFPILGLAAGLARRGFVHQRVLATPGARASVEAYGLEFAPILAGRDEAIFRIANTAKPVSGSVLGMLRQLRQNLALCHELRAELEARWRSARPDLVIADFTLPVAGLLARELGARWWTTTPSPCAIETRAGTPSYLGGWRTRDAAWSRLRDRAGNTAVRLAKRAMARCVRRDLAALGVPDIHREDGTEVVYSDERIFALGAREFELPRTDWPAALEFIGPLFASAPRRSEGPAPRFEDGCVHVLVSLGTHLGWAKRRAALATMAAARALPDWRFHFTLGRARLGEAGEDHGRFDGVTPPPNWTVHDFIPYDARLARYDLALVHGGTGVTYACLAQGVPLAVWPHDYDQFDHAVRVERCGVGLRVAPRRLARDLMRVHGEPRFRREASAMRATLARYDPVAAVERALREQPPGAP